MDPLRATHVHSALPVVAVDIVSFEPLDEGRKGGLEPDRGEGVIFDDLFVIDSQELVHNYQYFETHYRFGTSVPFEWWQLLSPFYPSRLSNIRRLILAVMDRRHPNLYNGPDKARLGGLECGSRFC